MRRLLCFIKGHEWKHSLFVWLGASPGEYTVRCLRCGKYENRP